MSMHLRITSTLFVTHISPIPLDNIIYAAPSSNDTAEGMYAVLTRVSNSEEDSEPHYEFDSELHNGFPEPRFPTINYQHYTPSSATDAPVSWSRFHIWGL